MTRYIRTQITQLSANESAAIQQINKNLEDIQAAIQDTVSRSGQSPTHMTADFDLNGKRIINVPAPLTDNDLVRRVDVVEDIATVQSLVNTASTAAGQAIAAAEGVQEAIADAHVGIVADDLMLDENSKIRIAANNIDDITACVSDISDIQTVSGNITNVNAVAGNATNINTVASVSSDVTTVAGISSNVSSVASNTTNINTCVSNISAITGASTQAANAANSADAAAASATAAAISAAGTHFKLFQHGWFDYQLNDMAWLRADTFSWQDGTVYTNAYSHLVADIDGISTTTETIGSYTITYYPCADGHKIVAADQETTVANIYNESGVAWYYILDTTNTRFKLPRENPAREELIQVLRAKGSGLTLGLTDGTNNAGLNNSTGSDNRYIWTTDQYGQNAGHTSGTSSFLSGTDRKGVGVTTDSTKSGIISNMTDSTSVYKGKKYLYFYVGQFSQSATEQTAGLNAELFPRKVDLDAANLSDAGKSLVSGLSAPSSTYEDLTLLASGQSYTMPANGWLNIIKQGNSGQYVAMYNSTANDIGVTSPAVTNSARCVCLLQVSKGDSIQVNYDAGGSLVRFRFYYAIGSESEAS